MKRLTVLILSAALLCTLFIPSAHASNRYNPDDWRYIEDQVAVPSFSPPDKYYGGNCIYFVRHVCLSEDRNELPKYTGGAHRELVGLTVIEGGQWLNDVHGDERVNRGPTSAEVKAVFANAQSGDVVQMHWGGSSRNTQHMSKKIQKIFADSNVQAIIMTGIHYHHGTHIQQQTADSLYTRSTM